MTVAKKFRNLLYSDKLEFLLEAHNAVSAKIVEQTGFKGIWASGLSISTSIGYRDSNEICLSQLLQIIEYMADATSIPILLDADTGFGNFNNARILVRKLEQRKIAAVCIEDKIFPKLNSFINSQNQKLADIGEFCGKIKAMKDTQNDPDFAVVARTESFITGKTLDEALTRASMYQQAGADAVLIHSKKKDSNEIAAFMRNWNNSCPVIIVPTTYYTTPVSQFENMGIKMIIWANQMIRTSITHMRRNAEIIRHLQSVTAVENEIVKLDELFRLQDMNELLNAEKRYLQYDITRDDLIKTDSN